MNDEFLHQFYEAPRPGFADALYKRISQDTQPRFAQPLWKYLTFRNSVVAFVLLFFIAACVYAVSERRWDKIGNIWVYVQRTHKVDFSPPINFTPPTETSEVPEVQPLPDECWNVKEAKELLRFELRVPAWTPEEFTFEDRICGIDRLSDFANLYWIGPDQSSGIQIMLSNLRGFNMSTQEYQTGPATLWAPVAPGSYEEVQIHGQPAILIHGDWEAPWRTGEPTNGEIELKWDQNRALQLYWIEGEVLYELYTSADVAAEDLIKMAESTR